MQLSNHGTRDIFSSKAVRQALHINLFYAAISDFWCTIMQEKIKKAAYRQKDDSRLQAVRMALCHRTAAQPYGFMP